MGQDYPARGRIVLTIALPVIDQICPRGLTRIGIVHKSRVSISPNCFAGPPRRKLARCIALPLFLLASDRRDFDGTMTLGRSAECGARLDRLQLLGVADQHDFRALFLGFGHDTLELARANHPGFVDDKDVLARQPFAVTGPLVLKAR